MFDGGVPAAGLIMHESCPPAATCCCCVAREATAFPFFFGFFFGPFLAPSLLPFKERVDRHED